MPLVTRFTVDSVVKLLAVGLLLLTAIVLGRLTWVLVEPSSIFPSINDDVTSSISVEARAARLGGFHELAALHVFGSAAIQPKILEAPDTSLSWSLKGILSDPDPSRSAAILMLQGQKEKLYRVGAELPGNIRLQEILADRVILNRGGRLETLRLMRNTLSSTSSAARRAPPLPAVNNSRDGAAPRIDRDAWVNNPQRFLDVITASPVMQDGALYGLEVSPARNAREFEAAGLKSGDVITEVDGSSVADITDYRDLLKSLADAQSVSVGLERDGVPMNITISMD